MANITLRISEHNIPRWWIGGDEKGPTVCMSLPFFVRNDGYARAKLVRAWVTGTEGIEFIDPFVVEGRREQLLFIGAMMRPVVVEEDKDLTTEVFCLDSDGDTHKGGTVRFEAAPPGYYRHAPKTLTLCVFCNKPIPGERYYYATFAGQAHDTCIWPNMAGK